MTPTPELAIIIPTLDEECTLPLLLADLAAQEGVDLEVVVADGGSRDGTLAAAAEAGRRFPHLHLRPVPAPRGRARQLNIGAVASSAPVLLFLHADSRLPDRSALRLSLAMLDRAVAQRGDHRVAGRFSLCFTAEGAAPSAGYYLYECKARLNRHECIHGDQGMMLPRRFFTDLGGFAEDALLAEDNRLADAVFARGEWLLFPASIRSSTRRFQREGLRERQTLNAVIMALLAISREEFLRRLPPVYVPDNDGARLDLVPLFRALHDQIRALPRGERRHFWLSVGGYVRNNAWQLFFCADALHNFRHRRPAGTGGTPLLHGYDRYLDRLTNHLPGRMAAALLTQLWFWFARQPGTKKAGQETPLPGP